MSSEEEKDSTKPEIGSEIVYDKEPDDHDEIKSREKISTFKDISGFIGNFVWELFQTYKELCKMQRNLICIALTNYY
jgi:hypothetical protein